MYNVQVSPAQGGPSVTVWWDGTVYTLTANGAQIRGSTTTMWQIMKALAFALDAKVEENQ